MSAANDAFIAHLSGLVAAVGEAPFPPLPPGVSASAVETGVVVGTAGSEVSVSGQANLADLVSADALQGPVNVSDQEELASVAAPPAGSDLLASPLSGLDPPLSCAGDLEFSHDAWDLLNDAPDDGFEGYYAGDEQDWYSEVREDGEGDASLLEGAEASEPFEIVDPDASVDGAATQHKVGRFYMRTLQVLDRVPKVLPPGEEHHDMRRQVVEMSAKRRRMNIPKLPWETGTMNLVFSKRPVLGERDWSCSGVLLLAADTDVSTADEMPGIAPEELGRVASVFAKKLIRMKAPASEEQIRAAALKRLKVLICLDPTATKLGMSLLDKMRDLCEDEIVVASISDAFRSNASQTLIKRAGSLERFARWSFEQDSPSPFRAGELEIYRYLCHLRDTGAKPTSANHFLQAWRFAHGALHLLHSPPSEVISTRCEGASRDQYLMTAPLKQKSPFSRLQVTSLELQAVETVDTKVVCVLGQILFCLHASCRWSDSQRIVSISRQETDGVVLLVVDALTAKHTYTQESQ